MLRTMGLGMATGGNARGLLVALVRLGALLAGAALLWTLCGWLMTGLSSAAGLEFAATGFVVFGTALASCLAAGRRLALGAPLTTAVDPVVATLACVLAVLCLQASWSSTDHALRSSYAMFRSDQASRFASLSLLLGLCGAGAGAGLRATLGDARPLAVRFGLWGVAAGAGIGAAACLALLFATRFGPWEPALIVAVMLAGWAARVATATGPTARPTDLARTLGAALLVILAATVACAVSEILFNPGGSAGWNVFSAVFVTPPGVVITAGLLYGAWRLSRQASPRP